MSSPLSQALHTLSQYLVVDAPVGETLRSVAEISVGALPGAAFAGMSLLDEQGRPTTGVFTDDRSPEIDQSQYESGRGPCLDAWRRKQLIRLDDIGAARGTYPEFAQACLDHGVHATLSVPLIAGGEGLGALNFYSTSVGAFSEDDEEIASDLVATAAVVLANASAYWGAVELGQQMTEAVSNRAVIEQAKGMLMARSPGLDADGAFEMLRRASQRENVKLREIARRIVEGATPAS
jgi:GAF domain-containing protein